MTRPLHPKARRAFAAMTDSRPRRAPLARTKRQIAQAHAEAGFPVAAGAEPFRIMGLHWAVPIPPAVLAGVLFLIERI